MHPASPRAIYTDASKKDTDTGYAFMASGEDLGEGGGDEGETVDGLAIRPTVHLLSEAHQQTGGRHNQVVGFGKAHMPNRTGMGSQPLRGHRERGGRENGKKNAVVVQLMHLALPQTEREIRKEIKSIAEHRWQQWWKAIPKCGTAKAFFVVPPHSTGRLFS